MRRGRRGKSPGTLPRTTPRQKDAHAASPDGRRKPSGDDRRAASPLPARRQARHAHGGLSRPFGRWTGADEEARLDNAPSACQSPAFPACPPPQPPLPPRAPPSPLHSRAWSHAPSALRRESPSGTTLRAVGIRNCDDGRRGGRGGFCRRALRGHCRVVAQRCRRWGASATPAQAAVGVWYRGSFCSPGGEASKVAPLAARATIPLPSLALRSGTIALARNKAPHHATTRRRGRPWPRPLRLYALSPRSSSRRSAGAFYVGYSKNVVSSQSVTPLAIAAAISSQRALMRSASPSFDRKPTSTSTAGISVWERT